MFLFFVFAIFAKHLSSLFSWKAHYLISNRAVFLFHLGWRTFWTRKVDMIHVSPQKVHIFCLVWIISTLVFFSSKYNKFAIRIGKVEVIQMWRSLVLNALLIIIKRSKNQLRDYVWCIKVHTRWRMKKQPIWFKVRISLTVWAAGTQNRVCHTPTLRFKPLSFGVANSGNPVL